MIENNNKFWTNGNGKNFVNWSGTDTTIGIYDTNIFYSFDEKVDALVKIWLKNGAFSTILKSLENDTSQNLPNEYIALKKELEIVPDWVDENLLKAGCELSVRSGLISLLVLRNFSLLSGYNFANLTKPLIATGSLNKKAVHRLYNTLNFWINVTRIGNDAQSKRINACIRTRLVHSVSRLMIQDKNIYWNKELYGEPINNADMIATNIAFTVYYLYGLKKLNFKYSETEEKGIFHLWKYITYLLGVPLEILPNNKLESLEFFKFWTRYQNPPDEDSQTLASSLLAENTSVNVLKFKIIKRNMTYIHNSIANYLIDDEIQKNLNIPHIRFKFIILASIKLRNKIPNNKENQIIKGNYQQLSVLDDYKNNIA